jgi:hypothetical protein
MVGKPQPETSKENTMARFPSREAEVAALASEIINGLTENAEDFPAPPLGAAELQAKLDAYRKAHEAAVLIQSKAAEAFDLKDEALASLSDDMRLVLQYAEHAVKDDEVKLQALGWDVRKQLSEPQVPGPARALEVKREGPGWVYLDWKKPSEGGLVAAYHVQVARSEGGDWKDVCTCFETMAVLTNQERGIDLVFRVVTVNRIGEGLASNTVTAFL